MSNFGLQTKINITENITSEKKTKKRHGISEKEKMHKSFQFIIIID